MVLLFERFLNPSRVSMPDIDLDFQDDRRSCLIKYCADKYGHDKVAAIITFGTLGAKAAIRDVGRVMDIPLSEVDQVSKMIPSTPSKPITIPEALEEVKELKELYDTVPYLKELIDTAHHMEGVVRNVGTHAAGIVITDEPVTNYVPIHRPTSNSDDTPVKSVTQYEMAHLDALGLLKVDFLGLATLTVMARACAMINARHGIEFSLENIPVDDAPTFEFLGTGHTAGVFQLEGSGMTRYLVQMQPKNLAQIIAMVALYRPGPLEFIPSYIKRIHGEEEVTYRHAIMEPIFKETYGIAIYQEQIMFAAMEIGGYTAAEADGLRSAISKKKAKEIELHREKFISGAESLEIMDRETAEAIFTDWENFARYGFNKSHAADYGIIAVQTAYLKKHFPFEYMTALLSASKNEMEKVAFYVSDCRDLGIEVLPPDVNSSDWDFSIEDLADGKSVIRFGLGAVKNVGQTPVQIILDARNSDGPFETINDFAKRVDLRLVGKRALESLVRVGALDKFGDRRAILEALDRITAVSTSHFKAALSGQMSIFGLDSTVVEEIELPKLPALQIRELLEWEKELIGLYVSSHPMQSYTHILKKKITRYSSQLLEMNSKSTVIVGGMITRFRRLQTKNGKDMCFATMEDMHGPIELVIFPNTWTRYREFIQIDRILLVEGKLDNDGNEPKILVDSIIEPLLENSKDSQTENQVEMSANTNTSTKVDDYGYEIIFGGEGELEEESKMTLIEPPELQYNLAVDSKKQSPQQFTETFPEDDDMPPAPDFPDDWFPLQAAAFEERLELADPQEEGKEESKSFELIDKTEEIEAKTIITSALAQEPIAPQRPKITELPVMIPPLEVFSFQKDTDKANLHMITVVLRSNFNEADQGVLRMKRVVGLLRSYPGKDRFGVLIFERGKHFRFEFPNDTTGFCPELMWKLQKLVGEENVQIEIMHVH